jgi:hypothetical protein
MTGCRKWESVGNAFSHGHPRFTAAIGMIIFKVPPDLGFSTADCAFAAGFAFVAASADPKVNINPIQAKLKFLKIVLLSVLFLNMAASFTQAVVSCLAVAGSSSRDDRLLRCLFFSS